MTSTLLNTVTIRVDTLELFALKKLSLVSHALAEKMGGSSGRELSCLARCLDDLVRRIEIGLAHAATAEPSDGGAR